MTDPNRERWEREAASEALHRFHDVSACIGFKYGWIAAAEKYAPRWIEVATSEHDALLNAGWSWTFSDGDGSLVLLFPPGPPPPGASHD